MIKQYTLKNLHISPDYILLTQVKDCDEIKNLLNKIPYNNDMNWTKLLQSHYNLSKCF